MRPRLFLHVVGLEARKRLSYRFDFWIQALVSFAAELGIAWFLWQAIFHESGKTVIGGRTLDDMVLYYVAVILVAKLARGNLFAVAVASEIYDGGLNRYLVYPVPYLGFKLAQSLGTLLPATIQLFAFGAIFPFLVKGSLAHPTAASVAMGLVSILVAHVLYFVMQVCLEGVAFWADNVWSLNVALRLVSGLLGGIMIPLAAFPDAWQPVLAALPFRHVFSDPVEALLGQRTFLAWAGDLGVALAWTAAFTLVARWVFRRGSYAYTGVGI